MGKAFDCVKMKRKGTQKLQKKLAGLTLAEELNFWQERTKELKREKDRLINDKGKRQKTNRRLKHKA